MHSAWHMAAVKLAVVAGPSQMMKRAQQQCKETNKGAFQNGGPVVSVLPFVPGPCDNRETWAQFM